jgi:hypothetical protein
MANVGFSSKRRVFLGSHSAAAAKNTEELNNANNPATVTL